MGRAVLSMDIGDDLDDTHDSLAVLFFTSLFEVKRIPGNLPRIPNAVFAQSDPLPPDLPPPELV